MHAKKVCKVYFNTCKTYSKTLDPEAMLESKCCNLIIIINIMIRNQIKKNVCTRFFRCVVSSVSISLRLFETFPNKSGHDVIHWAWIFWCVSGTDFNTYSDFNIYSRMPRDIFRDERAFYVSLVWIFWWRSEQISTCFCFDMSRGTIMAHQILINVIRYTFLANKKDDIQPEMIYQIS